MALLRSSLLHGMMWRWVRELLISVLPLDWDLTAKKLSRGYLFLVSGPEEAEHQSSILSEAASLCFATVKDEVEDNERE